MLLCLDVEGSDSGEKAEKESYETRFCTFSAAFADILMFNIDYNSITTSKASNFDII